MKDDHSQYAPTLHRKGSLNSRIPNFFPNNRSFIIIVIIITFSIGYLTPSLTDHIITRSSNNTNDKINNHNLFTYPQCSNKTISSQELRSTILHTFYDGVPPYKNFPPPHIARLLRPTKLNGWGSKNKVFSHLIKKVRPRIIIEVGTFLGASATHMANLTRQLGLDTQILCIDDFRGWAGFRDMFKGFPMQNGNVMLLAQFMQNVITLNYEDVILPLPFSSSSTLDRLCQMGVMGDLIEIDAAHDFHSAWGDINRAYKLLRPGGILFGHDYFNEQDNYGVQRAVDLFVKLHAFSIATEEEHWILIG